MLAKISESKVSGMSTTRVLIPVDTIRVLHVHLISIRFILHVSHKNIKNRRPGADPGFFLAGGAPLTDR